MENKTTNLDKYYFNINYRFFISALILSFLILWRYLNAHLVEIHPITPSELEMEYKIENEDKEEPITDINDLEFEIENGKIIEIHGNAV